MLNEWIVAWVAHQAPRAPLHLFDANIFHPEPRALAFSEHMTVQGLMGAPVLWLGASPLLAYNLLVIAGLALSAWAMWLLLVRWTGSHAAGAVAGTLVAFNAHTLTRLPHLQALHLEFIPLVLLALDRLLVERRVRDAVLLGVACALQGLTSNYLLVFTAMAAVAGIAVRADEWLTPGASADHRAARAGGGRGRRAAGAVPLPVLPHPARAGPHPQPRRSGAATPPPGATTSRRPAACTTARGATASSKARRHSSRAWSRRSSRWSRSSAKPGLRDARIRMIAAIGAAGVALSFGPALPGYAALYHWLPLMQGVRGAARFGFLALIAVAVLAGFGMAALRERYGRRAVVAGSGRRRSSRPSTRRRCARRSRTGRSTASRASTRRSATRRSAPSRNSRSTRRRPSSATRRYVLNSTAHWKPLVNGYSGFVPASYPGIADALRDFPDDRSRAELQRLGVTHVVVHLDAYGDGADAMASALQCRAVAGARGVREPGQNLPARYFLMITGFGARPG